MACKHHSHCGCASSKPQSSSIIDMPNSQETQIATKPASSSRRHFLIRSVAQASAVSTLGLFAHPLLADSRNKERVIEFYIPRTGESIRSVFWTPSEGYISESISGLSVAMRDGRTDEVKRINTKTLDIVSALQNLIKPRQPTHLISGYRSPLSNRQVGGAKESYHMKAMASDIKMPGVNYNTLLSAAKRLKAGGVGRYTRSGFVHVDCGPIRYWGTLGPCDCGAHDDENGHHHHDPYADFDSIA